MWLGGLNTKSHVFSGGLEKGTVANDNGTMYPRNTIYQNFSV